MNDLNDHPHHSRTASFRNIVFRGLGVVLPPLLTIVVLIWAWKTIESYILQPTEWVVRVGLVAYSEWDDGTFESIPKSAIPEDDNSFIYEGYKYVAVPNGRRYIPKYVVDQVEESADQFVTDSIPLVSANAYWHRYMQSYWMQRRFVVPIFLVVFLTLLYFLGRLFTFGLGRWFFRSFDAAILRIPFVNKVYGGVKQVTDFAFSEREIEFNNVVAVQYPSKGIWSLGFVTGNSVRQLNDATGEEMMSVLMPTSPMPMTGFTVTVKRSDTIDIDMTIDEAIQFVVSCGVVVPPHQRVESVVEKGTRPKGKLRDGAIILPGSATTENQSDPSTV